MENREDNEFVFDSDIYNRNLWDFEKIRLTKKQYQQRLELILGEERSKMDEFIRGECLEQEIRLDKCISFEVSLTNYCYKFIKNFWQCKKIKKEYITNKEVQWKEKQYQLYSPIIKEDDEKN
eukprot:TRINITY_DN16274_c0_g1_i1.p1 TRINITY_DN16274_c0_g1~~TRINITY_DN16274_c0_g1_i1.p1  ORF type:complete len:122 (-),score=36.37 TRINITY_DN16274_c0_g1_i1:44-409(-)